MNAAASRRIAGPTAGARGAAAAVVVLAAAVWLTTWRSDQSAGATTTALNDAGRSAEHADAIQEVIACQYAWFPGTAFDDPAGSPASCSRPSPQLSIQSTDHSPDQLMRWAGVRQLVKDMGR